MKQVIKHILFYQTLPNDMNKLPIAETTSQASAWGTIEVNLPINAIETVTCQVYHVLPPSKTVPQWSRLLPDLQLQVNPPVAFTYADAGEKCTITWTFDPTVIDGVAHNQYYAIEFFVNNASIATVKSNPTLIAWINNPIDFTSTEGWTGISIAQGSTGIQGVTGPAGTGSSGGGVTGLQGQTGTQGVTGFSWGTTGLQGSQGDMGLPGINGATGLQGLTGIVGANGSQGVTGLQGSQEIPKSITDITDRLSPTDAYGNPVITVLPDGTYGTSAFQLTTDSTTAYSRIGVFSDNQSDYYGGMFLTKYASNCTLIYSRPFGLPSVNGLSSLETVFTPLLIGTRFSADPVFLGTNDVCAVKIDGDQNVVIGTIDTTATQKLYVTGDIDSSGYRIHNTAPVGHYLRGNGSHYTDATIQLSDLPVGFGATGIAGATGIGLQGVTGLVGFTGTIGIAGTTGVQGITGLIGLGIQGVTGVFGQTGTQGVTGLRGLTGLSFQGSTGLQGLTGLIGVTGSIGLSGATGIQGLGIQGVTGTLGINGVTGVQGLTGFAIIGSTGAQGLTGLSLSGVTGVMGITGVIGFTGSVGLAGATGIQGLGIQGTTGTGTVGSQGATGLSGSVGSQGITGLYGRTGVQGIQGNTGLGIQGVTGLYGRTGIQGQTGLGTQGLTGLLGIQGVTGIVANSRVYTTTSTSTPTPNANTTDVFILSALSTSATFGAPTGSPTDAQRLLIKIHDDGTAHTLSWNAVYTPISLTLPSTTHANKFTYVGTVYNSTASTWDVIALGEQA